MAARPRSVANFEHALGVPVAAAGRAADAVGRCKARWKLSMLILKLFESKHTNDGNSNGNFSDQVAVALLEIANDRNSNRTSSAPCLRHGQFTTETVTLEPIIGFLP
jgi:hypothetical protein